MPEILAQIRNDGVPVNGLTTAPRITIRRADTGTAVVTAQSMTDLGADGHYRYSFTPDAALDYAFSIDADPIAAGQVKSGERYFSGGFPGLVDVKETKLDELWTLAGLKTGSPLTITDAARAAGGISQTIADDGTTTTVDRP